MKLVSFSILCAVAITATCFGTLTYAYEGERLRLNIGQDYANCFAFYTIAAYATGNTDSAKQYTALANAAGEAGILVLTQKEFQAKAELSLAYMSKVAKDESMSRLILEHGPLCKNLLENPKERMQYWKEQK